MRRASSTLLPTSSRYCRHFAAGELKVEQCGPLRSATENLSDIADTSASGGRYHLLSGIYSTLIYTNAYTFRVEKWPFSVATPKARKRAGFQTRISAENKCSRAKLKIQFREECGFDSHRPHHPILQVPRSPPHGGWNLHQRIAWGRTSRAPLREMTIARHCHAGTRQPIRGAAIATNRQREASIRLY